MASRRASPHTPFIPPLNSPSDSPQPPVIPQLAPSSSSGSNQGFPGHLPTTPSTPWPASAYPPSQGGAGPAQPAMFPNSGYPAFGGYPMMTPAMPPPAQMGVASPFMPNMAYMSPGGPGFIPPGVHAFTPNTPAQPPQLPPGAFPQHGGGIHPNGMSYDWIGYPPFGMTPGAPGAVPLSAPTNHANQAAAAMQAQQAQAQAARAAAAGGYTGFGGGPMSAPVLPPQTWGPPGGGAAAWGFATPAAGMHQPLGGAWGGGMDALAGGMAGMGIGGGGGIAARRPIADIADRVGEFATGENYYPVLTPFIMKIVKAKMKLNPILQAPATSSSGHLDWNVLFPSATIHYSKDPAHKSWAAGRNDPATFPRTTQLRILTTVNTYPWCFTVDAQNPKVGVTCGEIIEQVYTELRKMTTKGDWITVQRDLQQSIAEAYRFNRGRDPGAPGGMLGDGMRRLDYLREYVWWGGLEVVDPDEDRESANIMRTWLNQHGPTVVGMPCVALMRLERMSTRSVDEVRDWDRSRQRRASTSGSAAGGRARSSSRAPSAQGGWSGGLGASSRSRPNSRAGSRPGSRVGVRVQGPSDSDESDDSSD